MKNKLQKLRNYSIIIYLSLINITTVFAESTVGNNATDTKIRIELKEPIGNLTAIEADTAIGFIETYIRVLYLYGASIIGLISVLVIAISGMQYGFSSDGVEDAKKRITNSLMALAVLFSSAIFLYFLNPNFFKL